MNRPRLWLAGQAAVSIALLAWLGRALDLGAISALFRRLPIWFYLVSLIVIIAGQVIYAWRWRLVLAAAGVRAPFSQVLRQYFIGIFLNNFLPSTIGGDLGKVYLLGRDYGYRPVTASVIVDRMLGLGLLAAYASLMLWSFALDARVLVVARAAVTAVAAASLAAVALTIAGTGGLQRRVTWLGRRAVLIADRLQRLRIDMAAGVTNRSVIAKAALVVIGYFLAVGAVYVTFIRLQAGIAPPFALTMAVVMATSVLSNVPVSFNGLGLREQLHVTLLAPLSVSPEVAVSISLLLFAHLLVGSLAGLVFWMQARALPADVPARAEE